MTESGRIVLMAYAFRLREVDTVQLAMNKIGAISFWLDYSLKPTDILHYFEARQLTTLIVHEVMLSTIA